MRQKKVKGFWVKKVEKYKEGSEAKSRARYLRDNSNISHVVVRKRKDFYEVRYSVAGHYLEELEKAGISL